MKTKTTIILPETKNVVLKSLPTLEIIILLFLLLFITGWLGAGSGGNRKEKQTTKKPEETLKN